MPEQSPDSKTAAALRVKYRSATREAFVEHFGADVSDSGIFLKTRKPLEVGMLLRLHLQLRDGQPLIVGAGRVSFRRTTDGAFPAGMGVEFLKLDADSQALVASIVSSRDGAPSRFEEREGAELAPALTTHRTRSDRPNGMGPPPPNASFRAGANSPVTRPRAPRVSPATIPGVFSDTGMRDNSLPPPPPLSTTDRPHSTASTAPPAKSSISGTFFPEEELPQEPPAEGRRARSARPPATPDSRKPPMPSGRPPTERPPKSVRAPSLRATQTGRPDRPPPPPQKPTQRQVQTPPALDSAAAKQAQLREATGYLASTFAGAGVAPATADAARSAVHATAADSGSMADLFDDLDLEVEAPLPLPATDSLSQASPLPRPPSARPGERHGNRGTTIPPGFDVDASDLQELSVLEPESEPPPAVVDPAPAPDPADDLRGGEPLGVQAEAPPLPPGDLSGRADKGSQIGFLLALVLLGLLAFAIAYVVARGKLPTDLVQQMLSSTTGDDTAGRAASAAQVDIEVTTEPLGAVVSVDGEARGKSPLTLRLAVGAKTAVMASYPGHADAEILITPAAEAEPLTLKLIPRTFVIHVESRPAGADARALGIAGDTPCDLDLGFLDSEVKVLVRKDGYGQESFTLMPDQFVLKDNALRATVSVDLHRSGKPLAARSPAPKAEAAEAAPEAAAAPTDSVLSLRPAVPAAAEAPAAPPAEPPAPPVLPAAAE